MSSHSHALLHSNTRGKAWGRVCTVDQEDYISAETLVNTTVIGQTAHFFLKQKKYEWKFPFSKIIIEGDFNLDVSKKDVSRLFSTQ